MKQLRHQEGFSSEWVFHLLLIYLGYVWKGVDARKLHYIIRYFSPKLDSCLFMVRPCKRQLRYIGRWDEEENAFRACCNYFVVGNIYKSKDFNGATYSFYEYKDGDGRTGCAYFERIT